MSIFIGRDRELHTLVQALHAARQGTGACILVTGEAGIGKSRLIKELKSEAAPENFQIVQGNCFEQDISFPYAPWIDALRAFLAPQSPEEIANILGPFSSEIVKLLPELSLLLPAIQPSPALDPPAEKHRLFDSLARLMASVAAVRPLLIVLEDLHWSDEQSLEFLAFLVRRSAMLPILIVGAYRSEDASQRLEHHLIALGREHVAEEIRLSPLPRAEVARMAQAILGMEGVPSSDLLDLLMPLAEGNPLYVDEITKSLAERGLDQQITGTLEIPRSIQDMVQRRVEQLPQDSRRILSFAAAIGERFEFGLLAEVTGQEEPELLRALRQMIDVRLIVEESADQFAFRHALMRAAVYGMLMQRERRAMHKLIGETMERLHGTRVGSLAPELAYHFYQAAIWEKATLYSQRAGESAQALYARREALFHFTHALDAARYLGISPPRSCLRGRAQAHDAGGDFDRALADYEASLDWSRREADRSAEWQALIDLGLLWQSRDLVRAGEYYHEALDLAQELQDPSLLAQSLNRIGNWNLNWGLVEEALPAHQQALALFRQTHDLRGTAQTLELLGMVSYQLGKVSQGTGYLEEAVPILRELDERQALVNTLINLAFRVRLETEVLGDTNCQDLVEVSEQALQIARASNWRQGELRVLIILAGALAHGGNYSRALESLHWAASLAEDSRGRESFVRLHMAFGSIFLDLLAWTEARQHFETALSAAQGLRSGLLTLAATSWLVSVLIAQNALAPASDLLDRSIPGEYPEGRVPYLPRRLWSLRAELALEQGDALRALEIADRLLADTADLEEQGPHTVPLLSRLRGRALAALGRWDEAEAEFRGTLPAAIAQGQRPMAWRLYVDLGRVYRSMARHEDAEREFSSARSVLDELAQNVPEGPLREGFSQQTSMMLPRVHIPTARQAAKSEYGGLTAREREIAALIAGGKSNRGIADELVISEKTAERHITNILKKLGFSSRTQIAVWSAQKGLKR